MGAFSAATATLALGGVPICTIEGDGGAYRPDLISVPDAFRSTSGSVVLAESRSRSIRFYECPSGRLVRSVGTSGRGPGEFISLGHVFRTRGDSLLAVQSFGQPLLLFDSGGRYARNIASRGNVYCCFRDGATLITRTSASSLAGEPAEPMVAAFRLSLADGAAELPLGKFPASEVTSVGVRAPSGGGNTNVTVRTGLGRPFGRLTSVQPVADQFVVGDGMDYSLRLYSATGKLERIIRVDRPRTAVTARDAERYIDEQLSGLTGVRREAQRTALREAGYPKTLPAYRRVEVDDAGRLWVEDFPVSDSVDGWWSVFKTDGTNVGRIRVPKQYRVLSASVTHIVLRWTDGDGFARIVMFELVPVAAR